GRLAQPPLVAAAAQPVRGPDADRARLAGGRHHHLVRRQPAAGHHRPLAGLRPQGATAQRPDPGHRHQRQARPVRAVHRPRQRGPGRGHAVHRAGRARRADGPGAGVPRARAVPRARPGRVVPRGAGRRVLRRRRRRRSRQSGRCRRRERRRGQGEPGMTAVAVPPRAQEAVPGRGLQRAARTYSFGFAALLTVALLITNIATQHGGFGWSNQLANVAPMAIAALASAPSIIGGGFDLSISPLITLTNCVFVVYLLPHGLGGAIAVPIMLGIGLVVGALNGILIVLLRVQPIVVTLAMFFSLQGIDLIIAPNPASVPGTGWVRHLATTVGAVPGAIFTIGIPLLIWVALRFVPFRRLLYAVGSNDATAFSSGVNVNSVRITSYALGGLFAGFGGLALTGLVSSADASNATEYTLTAIAAVVLGGTALAGGRGGLIGPLLGAFSIYLLQNLLATFAINPAYLQM